MKELENVLDSFLIHLADTLRDLDEASYRDGDIHERVRGIRVGARHLASLCGELLGDIQQRVYCIQVTTTVDMNIKVLAKNEDDAIEWACQTAEQRVHDTIARDYDVYWDSVGEVLGHESQADDEAEEEYQYDD